MKNIIKVLIVLFVSLAVICPASATDLPLPVYDLLKTTFPKVDIRFDGLIELADGTKYLPVLPAYYENVEDPSKIVKTIPANTSLKSKPEMILFANNLALLKMIKRPDKNYILFSNEEIPLKVKLGLLPQDLVVPDNLIIPQELNVIIGDLKMSVKTGSEKKQPKNASSPIKPISNITPSFPELKDLVNKTFYAISYQSNQVYVLSSQTGKPIKTIQLTSIPSDITITNDNKYILAACMSSNKISVIDAIKNEYISDINVGQLPVSVVVSYDKAYVANKFSSSVSVIDTKNMKILEEISLTGSPGYLAVSEQDIYYNDSLSGKIYKLNLTPPENGKKIKSNIHEITQVNNVSGLILVDKYLLVLSRTDGKLVVYDLEAKKIFKTLEVGNKPVDMKVIKEKNKIYVLSAGSHIISVIDTNSFEITNKISLKNSGFPKSLNILDSVNKALVSDADSYEIAIIDLLSNQIIDYLPVNTTINSLLITQPVK